MKFSELSEKVTTFSNRLKTLREKRQMQTISKLRKLDSNLPNDSKCIHLAHNWLVCGKDKKVGAKAGMLLVEYYEYTSKLYKLSEKYYDTLYRKVV